jgi:hypothetical protein
MHTLLSYILQLFQFPHSGGAQKVHQWHLKSASNKQNGKKSCKYIGYKQQSTRKQLLFYAQNIKESDSNMTFLAIIKFLLQALVSLV